MDEALVKEYKRIRKAHTTLPASQAILWARGLLKPTTLDWELWTGRHVAVGKGKVDGFDVRAVVDYDDYATYDIGFTSEDTGIRNPHWHDGKPDRDKYVTLESGTVRELAPYFHKAGMAKNVAWEYARKSLTEEAASYLDNKVMCLVAHVTVSVAGVEVGEGGHIGTELLDTEYRLEKELDDFVSECGMVEEAIEDARKSLPAMVEAQKAIAASLEGLTK